MLIGTGNHVDEQIMTTKTRDESIAQKDILNRPELAWWLRLSERSIRNYEKEGQIPVIKIGRRRLYHKAAVLEALEKRGEK